MASSTIPKTVEKWEQIGASDSTSTNYSLYAGKHIDDYKAIAWYLIEWQNGAVEGFMLVPTSVFKQYNSTAKSMGINAYNGGRQYAYLNYKSDTAVGIQLSGGHSIAIWGIK